MTLDLEHDLRSALHREADRSPLPAREWTGPRRTVAAGGRRRRVAPIALAGAAAVVGVIGLATRSTSSPSGTQSVPTAPPTVPPGVEHPLVEVDPQRTAAPFATPDRNVPVMPGSVHVIEAQGLTITLFTTIDVSNGNRVEFRACQIWLDGTTLCEEDGHEPHVGRWGPPSDSAAQHVDTLTLWYNVPAGTEYVTYELGATELWQRPIGGLAVFPAAPGDERMQAIGPDGTVLETFDRATFDESQSQFDPSQDVFDNLDGDENAQVQQAAFAAANSCLAAHGLGDPTVPAPANAAATWDLCVVAAQTAATQRFDELGGEVVENPDNDPSVEAG